MKILGISGGLGHDAAAALLVDGQLMAYAEEERFLRKKHALHEAPVYAALHCLDRNDIKLSDIDYIALSWLPEKVVNGHIEDIFKAAPIFTGGIPPMVAFDHHLSHASAAYYASGFDEALILTIDGQSEDASTSIYHARNTDIALMKRYPIEQSIGYFYSSVSAFLELGNFAEGKLMGLAAYGEPVYDFPIELNSTGYRFKNFENTDNFDADTQYIDVRNKWFKYFIKILGQKRKYTYVNSARKGIVPEAAYTQDEKNLAASAQQALESIIRHIATQYLQKTGCKNLILAGGVGLNCNVNSILEKLSGVENYYVLPATSDSGTAIGGAFSLHASVAGKSPYMTMPTAYWGSAFDNAYIGKMLDTFHLDYQYHEDITAFAAKQLAQNKVIGWFQGKSEMGPRALGNRSIVSSATSKAQFYRINKDIKYREEWRPLAPSILEEYKDEVLCDAQPSPYMLKTYTLRDHYVAKTPAIAHIDHSTRPQTVNAADNPLWHKLLCDYHGLTGIPLLVNTSLNIGSEPICETPADCIRSFYASNLDYMIMGNYCLKKA